MPVITRYEIGFGPSKGPDYDIVEGLNGEAVSSVYTSTVGVGLPPTLGRRPGDTHADQTDPTYPVVYVLTGTPGASYTDTFDRPDSSSLNDNGVTGWNEYPAGDPNSWVLSQGEALGTGEFRALGRVFGPEPQITVVGHVSARSTGEVGVYSYSLEKGGAFNGYSLRATVNGPGVNLGIYRGNVLKASAAAGSLAAPFVMALVVNKTSGVLTGLINGVSKVTWTDPAANEATGAYCGLMAGKGQSIAAFTTVVIEIPGQGLKWEQVTTPPDVTVPNPPTGLTQFSESFLNPQARQAQTTVTFVPPSLNTDGSTLSDLDHYEVEWYHPNLGEDPWKHSLVHPVATAATTVLLTGLPRGQVLQVRMRAVDSSGNRSTFSGTSSATTFTETVAPPTPSAPTALVYLGVASVSWDGKTATGDPQPEEFAYASLHVGTSAGFTPNSTNYVDVYDRDGGVLVYQLPTDYTTPFHFKVRVYDVDGNVSDASASVSATGVQIQDSDVGTLNAGKINAGFLAAARVAAGSISASEKLTVGSIDPSRMGFGATTNLVSDPSFEDTEVFTALRALSSTPLTIWTHTTFMPAQGTRCLAANAAVGTGVRSFHLVTKPMRCITDERVFVAVKAAYDSGAGRPNGSALLRVQFYNAAGASVGTPAAVTIDPLTLDGNSLYKTYMGLVTAPANAVTYVPQITLDSSATSGGWYFDQVEARLAISGTAGTGSGRVEISPLGFFAYNSAGTETVSILGSTGTATFTGNVNATSLTAVFLGDRYFSAADSYAEKNDGSIQAVGGGSPSLLFEGQDGGGGLGSGYNPARLNWGSTAISLRAQTPQAIGQKAFAQISLSGSTGVISGLVNAMSGAQTRGGKVAFEADYDNVALKTRFTVPGRLKVGGGQARGVSYVQRRKTATQVVGPNTWSTLSFEGLVAAAVEDDGTLVTGTITFNATVSGLWLATATASFSGVPATSDVALRFLRNGGQVEGQTGLRASFSQTISTSQAFHMVEGATIQVQLIHNAGANANVLTDSATSPTRVTWTQIA